MTTYLTDISHQQIFPFTYIDGVLMDDGQNLSEKLTYLEGKINSLADQLGITSS